MASDSGYFFAMTVRFEVANFRSFHAPATLLLTAGRERRHSERLAKHPALSSCVLPISLIYGSNAAGKTNITEAIGFLKQLVSLGIQPGHAILRQVHRAVKAIFPAEKTP